MHITEINAHLKYRNTSGDTTVIYPITKAGNIDGTLPITSGGTGASTAANARANLGAAPAFTYGTDDIVAGSISNKADGAMHFVYTTKNGVWDHVKNIFITIDGVWRLVLDTTTTTPSTTYYSITTNLAGVTGASSNPTTISEGGTATLTFTASSGYTLPDSVTVTGATSSWNKSTGKLTLSNPTGKVSVVINGVAGTTTTPSTTYYSITTNLAGVTGASSNPTTISEGGTATLTFTASSGYTLPDSVTVTGATSSWNKSTGKLTLSNPTGKVSVVINGVAGTTTPTTISFSVSLVESSGYTLDTHNYTCDYGTTWAGWIAAQSWPIDGITFRIGTDGYVYACEASGDYKLDVVSTNVIAAKIYEANWAVMSNTYTTTLKIEGETVYEGTGVGASPDLEIVFNIGKTTSNPDQYANLRYKDGSTTRYVNIYTCTDATKNFLGFSETSGATVATYGSGNNIVSGTNGADTVVNLYPVLEDATMYDTVIDIDSKTVKIFSYKNFSPDVSFTVTETGAEFTCELTGEEYTFAYDGTDTFAALVYDELDYNIGNTGTIYGWDASDTTAEFTTFAWSVTEDTVQPLKFYTLDGSDFTVSTQYAGISNVEYSYDNNEWTSGSLGRNSTSTLTSKNGVIYLRGTNASFGGPQQINSRGIGVTFSEPVMCTGDLVSMLTYEGRVDEVDNRRFFGFFIDSTNLLCPPNLPSTKLETYCYEALFYGCTSMVVNTEPTEGYSREWRVPTTGTATEITSSGLSWKPLYAAFDDTAGTAEGTLDVNTTYYIKDLE